MFDKLNYLKTFSILTVMIFSFTTISSGMPSQVVSTNYKEDFCQKSSLALETQTLTSFIQSNNQNNISVKSIFLLEFGRSLVSKYQKSLRSYFKKKKLQFSLGDSFGIFKLLQKNSKIFYLFFLSWVVVAVLLFVNFHLSDKNPSLPDVNRHIHRIRINDLFMDKEVLGRADSKVVSILKKRGFGVSSVWDETKQLSAVSDKDTTRIWHEIEENRSAEGITLYLTGGTFPGCIWGTFGFSLAYATANNMPIHVLIIRPTLDQAKALPPKYESYDPINQYYRLAEEHGINMQVFQDGEELVSKRAVIDPNKGNLLVMSIYTSLNDFEADYTGKRHEQIVQSFQKTKVSTEALSLVGNIFKSLALSFLFSSVLFSLFTFKSFSKNTQKASNRKEKLTNNKIVSSPDTLIYLAA